MIYDWACNGCERRVEVERKMDDYKKGPEEACECGAFDYRRQINFDHKKGVKGFILLGDSGWQHTDYTRHRSIK